MAESNIKFAYSIDDAVTVTENGAAGTICNMQVGAGDRLLYFVRAKTTDGKPYEHWLAAAEVTIG